MVRAKNKAHPLHAKRRKREKWKEENEREREREREKAVVGASIPEELKVTPALHSKPARFIALAFSPLTASLKSK